jgi:hypothetical protein
MKPRKTEVWVAAHERQPVRIVSDAAVSIRGLFGGRLVPLLTLDTTGRPDIDELLHVHASLQPGDAKSQWAEIDGHAGFIALILKFIRPIETTVIIEFDIARQGLLVEQVLTSKGLYIQAGRDGDSYSKDPSRPKVFLEIPDMGFSQAWDDLFHKHLRKHFQENGLSRSDAKRAAQSVIEELRKFGSFRMPDLPPGSE